MKRRITPQFIHVHGATMATMFFDILNFIGQAIGAVFVFLVVLVSQFWLIAQVEPPGGNKVRAFYLTIMVTVAAFAAFAYLNPVVSSSPY